MLSIVLLTVNFDITKTVAFRKALSSTVHPLERPPGAEGTLKVFYDLSSNNEPCLNKGNKGSAAKTDLFSASLGL